MPRVSVLMSSYNHEKYVAQAIQSVLDQTFIDFEFLIVDDCSSDKTWEVIQSFNDPRIKAKRLPVQTSATETYPALFKMMSPETAFVALINSDDFFMPQKIEKQLNFLEQHAEYGLVFSDALVVDSAGNSLFSKPESNYTEGTFAISNRSRHEWLRQFIVIGNCLCAPSVFGRKKYATIKYFDTRFVQLCDLNAWIKVCGESNIYVLSEKLVGFRVLEDGQNLSAATWPKTNRFLHELFEIIVDLVQDLSLQDVFLIFNELYPDLFHDNKADIHDAKLIYAEVLTRLPGRIKQNAGLHLLYQLSKSTEAERMSPFDRAYIARKSLELEIYSNHLEFDLLQLRKEHAQLRAEYQCLKKSLNGLK